MKAYRQDMAHIDLLMFYDPTLRCVFPLGFYHSQNWLPQLCTYCTNTRKGTILLWLNSKVQIFTEIHAVLLKSSKSNKHDEPHGITDSLPLLKQ